MTLANACLWIVKPRNQIFLFVMTVFGVVFFAILKKNEFTSFEERPALLAITPNIIHEWGGDPNMVKVGISISNFPIFKMTTNEFIVDAVVWFEYDPAHVSTETLGKFSFEKGEITRKSPPDSKMINNLLLTQYEVRIKFSSNIDYTLFPLDGHRIFISLENTYVFPSDIILTSEKKAFTISAAMHLEEWNITNTHVNYGYEEIELEKFQPKKIIRYPKIVFSIDVTRIGIRQILLIFLPLFLIFLISLFSLSFDPKTHKGEVLSLSLGAVSSAIAYRFVIQNLAPNVGYFILSDHMFMILLSFMFLNFILGVTLIFKGELTPAWIVARGFLLLLFHFVFLTFFYVILFKW